ncbi:MAG TPA: hypothetical protein VFE16_07325, partial [Candidatus Cybelea sp.]|nr:hypothetical protein [Candidatus Cybelea sp.]
MKAPFDYATALACLNAEIERAQRAADAESAYDAANGREGPNPWANSGRALADLEADREQLTLRVKGQALTKSILELKRLDQEIAEAELEREHADRVLRQHSEHESVKRYLAATAICMRNGWGHSW